MQALINKFKYDPSGPIAERRKQLMMEFYISQAAAADAFVKKLKQRHPTKKNIVNANVDHLERVAKKAMEMALIAAKKEIKKRSSKA